MGEGEIQEGGWEPPGAVPPRGRRHLKGNTESAAKAGGSRAGGETVAWVSGLGVGPSREG